MKVTIKIILTLLVLLAISSGITKIMLMPQDLEFFGKYGFNNFTLIIFGVVQVVGGVLLVFRKMRVYGSIAVFMTFGVSLILLVLEGKYAVSAVTLISMALLVVVIRQNHITAYLKTDSA